MAASANISNLAPRVQARIAAFQKRSQAQQDRLSAFLSRQPANVGQSTRQQLLTQRLQQSVSLKQQWAHAIKNHFDQLHEVLMRGAGTEAVPLSSSTSNRRKASSAGE